MHYTKVNIRRDELTDIVLHVGAWELPILELKHGTANMQVGELVEFKNRDWPADAGSEMARLGQLYGRTGAADNAGTFAEEVYGKGSMGIKALQRAIDEARAEAEPKKSKGKATEDLVGAASA